MSHNQALAKSPTPRGRSSKWLLAALGAAAALFIGISLWQARHQGDAPEPAQFVANDSAALILHTIDAQWQPSSGGLSVGDKISSGELTLESGWALIKLHSGAELMITGPATFRIISEDKISFTQGSVSILKPAASASFLMETPSVVIEEIQRLVTMQVYPEATDLLANIGAVSLRRKDGANSRLTAGQAFRVTPTGAIALDAVSREQLSSQFQANGKKRVVSFPKMNGTTLDDYRSNTEMDLLLHYRFNDVSSVTQRVPNKAGVFPESNGMIIGASLADGRRPDTRSLRLEKPTDGVRTSLPGSYESVTLMTWIRVDRLDHNYNGLFMSDGIKLGGLHWQIMDNGALRVCILDGSHVFYESNPVITPDAYGTWVHVAVVYDIWQNAVLHYYNGQLISRSAIEQAATVQFRSAMLGNWDPAEDKDDDVVRDFDGQMDEFSIYRRALSSEEVKGLFEMGTD